MPTPPRRCSTCRHFQPAPLWRKGWCRNPLLYAPHQNHLVDERELDCHRQFGDYWESANVAPDTTAQAPTGVEAATSTIAATETPVTAEPQEAVKPVAPSSESSIPDPVSSVGQRTHTAPGTVTRTRADYLRLVIPAAIIGVLLLGYVVWTGLLYRDASEASPANAIVAAAASPTFSATTTALVSATIPPTVQSPPTQTTSMAATTVPTAAPTVIRPTVVSGLRPNGAAIVDTGSNDGLRLRKDPGQTGVVLRSIKNGERLSIVDGPREADGITWWKVIYATDEGWVAGQFLKPAP